MKPVLLEYKTSDQKRPILVMHSGQCVTYDYMVKRTFQVSTLEWSGHDFYAGMQCNEGNNLFNLFLAGCLRRMHYEKKGDC